MWPRKGEKYSGSNPRAAELGSKRACLNHSISHTLICGAFWPLNRHERAKVRSWTFKKCACLQVRLLSYAIDAEAHVRGVSPCHHAGIRVPAHPRALQPPSLLSPPQPARAAPTQETGGSCPGPSQPANPGISPFSCSTWCIGPMQRDRCVQPSSMRAEEAGTGQGCTEELGDFIAQALHS